MKTVPSKADLDYIEKNKHMNVDDLSRDTGLTVAAIRKVVGKMTTASTTEARPAGQFSKLIGKRRNPDGTVVKGSQVTIMTPAASEFADETKQVGQGHRPSCIHKPLGDRN